MECLIARGGRHKWWGCLQKSNEYMMKVSWKTCGCSRLLKPAEFTEDGRGRAECSGDKRDRQNGLPDIRVIGRRQHEEFPWVTAQMKRVSLTTHKQVCSRVHGRESEYARRERNPWATREGRVEERKHGRLHPSIVSLR